MYHMKVLQFIFSNAHALNGHKWSQVQYSWEAIQAVERNSFGMHIITWATHSLNSSMSYWGTGMELPIQSTKRCSFNTGGH